MVKFLYKHKDVILVALLFIALLCIVFREVIFTDYIFARRDIARLYLPVRELAVESMKSLQAPLWNPYIFCGAPLHASIHHAAFYPLTLIYYVGDFTKGFSFFIILHIFLCGVFMYLFARSIGTSKLGGILAGFSFMFSGYVISTICLTTVLSSITWFPLVMLIFIKALKSHGYLLSIALGVVLSLMFLGGDPPAFIITGFLLFGVSAYLLTERLLTDKKIDIFIIYSFLIATGTFFLLTAFQTLPAIEYYSITVRKAMGWQEASAWSLPYNHLLSFIIPYFNEPAFFSDNFLDGQKWLDNYYLGIITILLAGFALYYRRCKRIVWFLFAIGVFSIAISLGKNFILFPFLFKFIPGFDLIRYPVRFIFIFTFAICALCGIGFDSLRHIIVTSRARRAGSIFLVLGFLSTLLIIVLMIMPAKIIALIMDLAGNAFHSDSSFVYADIFNLRRTLFYVSLFGVFLFLCSRTRRRNLIIVPVFLLMGFDLLCTNIDYNFIERIEYFKSPTTNISYIMKDKSYFRILPSPYSYDRFSIIRGESLHKAVETSKDLLANNRMMEFGIYDAWGYDSSKLNGNNEIAKLIYRSEMPINTNLLNLLSIKYISSHDNVNCYGYKRVSSTEKATIYLNERHLPKVMLLRKAIAFDDDSKMLDYMSTRKFNPKKEVLFSGEVLLSDSIPFSSDISGKGPRVREDAVEITKYKPREVEIEVSATKKAFLLLNDTYYPGWKAYVDGEKVEIYRADFFLRAIRVPAGEHSILFVYDPMSFKIGSVISAISLLFIIIYILIMHLRLTRK